MIETITLPCVFRFLWSHWMAGRNLSGPVVERKIQLIHSTAGETLLREPLENFMGCPECPQKKHAHGDSGVTDGEVKLGSTGYKPTRTNIFCVLYGIGKVEAQEIPPCMVNIYLNRNRLVAGKIIFSKRDESCL